MISQYDGSSGKHSCGKTLGVGWSSGVFLGSTEFRSWLGTWLNQCSSIWAQVLSWTGISSRLRVKLREILLDPFIYIYICILGNLCVRIASMCHCIYIIMGCVSKMDLEMHTWTSKSHLCLIHQGRSKYQFMPGIFTLPNYFLGNKRIIFFIAIIRAVKWYSKQLLWVYYTF